MRRAGDSCDRDSNFLSCARMLYTMEESEQCCMVVPWFSKVFLTVAWVVETGAGLACISDQAILREVEQI